MIYRLFFVVCIVAPFLFGSGATYAQWKQTNLPNAIFVFTMVEQGGVLFAAGQPSYSYDTNGNLIHPYPSVYRSTDRGENWMSSDSGIRGITVMTMFASDSFLFVGTYRYGIFLSSDYGLHWVQADSLEGWQQTVNINAFARHGKYLFSAAETPSNTNLIIRSSDNGRTWTRTKGGGGWPVHIVVKDTVVFAAYGFGGIWLTSDDGDSWFRSLNAGVQNGLCVTDSSVFALGQENLFRSFDYWNHQWASSNIIGKVITSDKNTLFVGHQISDSSGNPTVEVDYSSDYGVNWNNRSNGLPTDIDALEMLYSSGDYLFISGDHWALWRRPLSEFSTVNKTALQTGELILEPSYPDPFSSSTKITFALPQRSEVRLSVIDAAGRETLLIPSQNMDIGRHEITWNASHFPSGVYTVRLNSGGVGVSREIVVLR